MKGVAKASGRIGFSEEMRQMCERMGAATPGFTTMALNFHHTAGTIGEAARRGDRAGVLTALDRTLRLAMHLRPRLAPARLERADFIGHLRQFELPKGGT